MAITRRADGLVPRPGRANVGNRRPRSHATRPGARSSKERGALTWRNDPWVRRRIATVARMAASGYSIPGMEDTVARWCLDNGQPAVKMAQLRLDLQHYWELMAEEVKIDAQQHEESLKLFKREGFRAWRDPNEGAMVRSTGFTTAMEAEKQLMRLSGVLKQPHALQQNEVFQQLNPELVGSDEYRAAVGEILRLLPARREPSNASPDAPETKQPARTRGNGR
jgi:hypothetical protein